MKKTLLTRFTAVVVLVLSFVLLFGCGRDETGKSEFENNMLSDFTAEIDYLIDFDGNPVSGSAVITKNDELRLDVISPDPYSGISVTCDASGKADVVSISYSGIKAELPKAAMEKLVFLMNMMSERTACELDNQSDKSFKRCEEMYMSEDLPEAVPYEVSFLCDGTDYMFIYDSITGVPLEIFADNGYCRSEIKVKKLKTEEFVSEE